MYNDDNIIFLYRIRRSCTYTININNQGLVTIETDTVSGASPYIFNISMRSVWGMNGMHADGS